MRHERSVDNPLVSVVVPTKNEEITVGTFVDWCFEGFNSAGVRGEVLLMDASTDATPEIAMARGASVVNVPEPGLGAAYRAAKPHIRGDYVILGDADCTYDFRDISGFILRLEQGADLVMGSRFRGAIEKGSMPIHHQYFGTPVTSYIFRVLLGIPVTDIHCGMRALTRTHYVQLPFAESGWEYSSEMIVASRNLGGSISEVPINFLKEPVGRQSHQVRGGWTTPFKAGWGALRVVFTHALDRILIWPGFLLGGFFLLLALLRLALSAAFERWGMGISAGAAFAALSTAGFFAAAFGIVAACTYDRTGTSAKAWSMRLPARHFFTATAWAGTASMVVAVVLMAIWKAQWKLAEVPISELTPVFHVFLASTLALAAVSSASLMADHLKKMADHPKNSE